MNWNDYQEKTLRKVRLSQPKGNLFATTCATIKNAVSEFTRYWANEAGQYFACYKAQYDEDMSLRALVQNIAVAASATEIEMQEIAKSSVFAVHGSTMAGCIEVGGDPEQFQKLAGSMYKKIFAHDTSFEARMCAKMERCSSELLAASVAWLVDGEVPDRNVVRSHLAMLLKDVAMLCAHYGKSVKSFMAGH